MTSICNPSICNHVAVNMLISLIIHGYVWVAMMLRSVDNKYLSGVCGCPCAVKLPVDGVQGLDEVKNMIHKLYTALNIDQHQVGVAV